MEIREPGILFNRTTEASETNNAFIVLDRTLVRDKRVRFNASASSRLELHKGMYVQFLKISNDWYVFSSDSKDGYKPHKYSSKGYKICSTVIIDEILLSCEVKNPKVRLRLRRTNSEYKGHKLFLIDIKNPIFSSRVRPFKE